MIPGPSISRESRGDSKRIEEGGGRESFVLLEGKKASSSEQPLGRGREGGRAVGTRNDRLVVKLGDRRGGLLLYTLVTGPPLFFFRNPRVSVTGCNGEKVESNCWLRPDDFGMRKGRDD